MWKRVERVHRQMIFRQEWQFRCCALQKLDNLGFKCLIGRARKGKIQRNSPIVRFGFVLQRCLGKCFAQCKTNRRIARQLFAMFAPIFDNCDVRRAFPSDRQSLFSVF